MRNFFSLIALLSFSVFAQDAEEYKYEVEGNKAEYYIGTFKKGKGIDDLAAWYEKFNEWTQTKGNLFDQMSVAILTPYFSSELSTHDVMWVTNTPSPEVQFKGLQEWVSEGGPKLLKSLPVVNSSVLDTWQWVVSNPGPAEAVSYTHLTLPTILRV